MTVESLPRWALLASTAVLAFLPLFVLWLGSYFALHMNSEDYALVGAMMVERGAVPFRDFFGYTPPGTFYILAASFRFFGHSLLAARFLLVTLPKWLTVMLVCRACRRLGASRAAMVLAGAFATLALGNGTFCGADYDGVHPTILSTLLALAAVSAHMEFLLGGPPGWLALSGLITGLNALVRYDLALYAALAFAATACLSPRELRRSLRYYGLGLLVGAGPAAAYFLAKVPLADLKISLIDYPAAYLRLAGLSDKGAAWRVLPDILHVPRGAGSLREFLRQWWLYDAFRTLVFLAAGWGWLWLLGRLRRGPALDRRERGMAALLLLGTFLGGYYLKSRNLFSMPVPFFALLPVLLFRSWRARAPAAFWGVRLCAAWAAYLGYLMWCTKLVLPLRGHRALEIPAAQGIFLAADQVQVYESLVHAVQARVPPGERILVCDRWYDPANQTHELLYFLVERAPGTGFFDFYPGITDREDVQRRMVSDLVRNGVRYVIELDWAGASSPAAATGPIFREFLESRYAEVARFGEYRLLGPRAAR